HHRQSRHDRRRFPGAAVRRRHRPCGDGSAVGARVEIAAGRRAGRIPPPGVQAGRRAGRRVPAHRVHAPPRTRNPLGLMRSLIIAPADDEAALKAALASEADAVVIDLFVAPDRREAARARAARILKEAAAPSGARALLVRVSPLADGEADLDLDAVMASAPRAVLLPKARGAASVQ